MKIYFFILLLGLSLEYSKRLPKFGSETMYKNEYLYLDISSYKSGDYIYLEISSYCSYYSSDFFIRYQELDYSDPTSSYSFLYAYPYSYTSSGSGYNYDYTFYFKIKISYSENYLIITTPYSGCMNNFTVKHTTGGSYVWVYVIISIVAFIIIVIIIICCVKKRANYSNVIVDPLVPNNQYIYPPQPEYLPPPSQPQQPYYQSIY